MIAYFPSPYPDELLYSQLARYYTQSGYLAYTYAAQDLFAKKTVKPDIEFINKLRPDALMVMTNKESLEEIVLNHTMFPYYGRFIGLERRENAFRSLISMDGKHRNLLPIPVNKNRHLRYCPLCAANDRDTYGETYWHRIHQLPGINICPVHYCYLQNTNIAINSEGSPTLVAAEDAVDYSAEILYSGNQLEHNLACYVSDVFLTPVGLQTDIPIGKFLHSRLERTKYLSQRGAKRNMELLYSDFAAFYQSIQDHPLPQQWQLGKVFSNSRYNPCEICMVAMFLNITPAELTNMELPEKSQAAMFDETIHNLHMQGLNYQQIADKMDASYDVVKAIGEKRYGTYHYLSLAPMQVGCKKKDWKQIDQQRLPAVKEIISKLLDTDRPQRITVSLVEHCLELPKGGLRQCPLCLAEIQKHTESQEEYWTREILWAVRTIVTDRQSLNVTHIKKLTNLRNKNFVNCLPHLQELAKSQRNPYAKTALALFQEAYPLFRQVHCYRNYQLL